MKLVKHYRKYLLGIAFSLCAVSAHASGDNGYTALEVSDLDPVSQLHGDPINADLRIFMAGNQFVVMDQLVRAFKEQHPQYDNIFYVTLPPGTELKWIQNGGVEFYSHESLADEGLILPVMPDVYSTINTGHLQQLADAGLIRKHYTYAHNRLALMVKAESPLAWSSIQTTGEFYNLMADPNVRISEPDVANQGIERHIWQMYTAATKDVFADDTSIQALDPTMFTPSLLSADPENSLRRIVYYDKVNDGVTKISHIAHHLETPAWLRDNTVDLGPVWITEALYAINRLGESDLAPVYIDAVDKNGNYLDRRDKVSYMITEVEGVMDRRHKRAAKDWINFLRSDTAQGIYMTAGFQGATPDELSTPFVYTTAENDKDPHHHH